MSDDLLYTCHFRAIDISCVFGIISQWTFVFLIGTSTALVAVFIDYGVKTLTAGTWVYS
jgi:hypothetical protein